MGGNYFLEHSFQELFTLTHTQQYPTYSYVQRRQFRNDAQQSQFGNDEALDEMGGHGDERKRCA